MTASELDTLRERLANYLAAETAILQGAQEATVAGRRWRKAELAEIRAAIRDLRIEINDREDQASGGCRLYTGVPR